MAKRIKSHILERVISATMFVFGMLAIWTFISAYNSGMDPGQIAIIEILLIVVLGILAQTVILIRIYERI